MYRRERDIGITTLGQLYGEHNALPKPTCRRTTRTNISNKILGFSICSVTLGKPFAWVCFAQIFCTNFLYGFFSQFFCADFCADCLQELFVQMLPGFLHSFLGCPKTLAGKRQNFTEKIPCKIHHALAASGEGLGRQEVEVRLWPA